MYKITVLSAKGVSKIGENIIKGSTIIQNPLSLSKLQIKTFDYDFAQSSIKLQITGHSEKTRVFAFIKQFKDNQLEEDNANLFNSLTFPKQTTRIIPKTTNMYLNGRKLHEEYNYVLERKNAIKFPGNSLEKPTLLCKRMFVQDTKNSEQIAQKGTEFKREAIQGDVKDYLTNIDSKSNSSNKLYAPYYEFLLNGAKIYSELKIDNEGFIQIVDKDFRNYLLCDIVLIDSHVIINKEFTLLPEAKDKKQFVDEIKNRDMSIQNTLKLDQGYVKKKEFTIIKKDTNFKIDDILNTEYTLYDSLEKVIHLFKVFFMNFKGILELFSKSWKWINWVRKVAIFIKMGFAYWWNES